MNGTVLKPIRRVNRAVAFALALVMVLCIPVMPGMTGYEVHAASGDITISNGVSRPDSVDFQWTSVGGIDFQNELTHGAVIQINKTPESGAYTLDLGENKITVQGKDYSTKIYDVAIKTSASAITLQALSLVSKGRSCLEAINDIELTVLNDVMLQFQGELVHGIFAHEKITIRGDDIGIHRIPEGKNENGGCGIYANGNVTININAISVEGKDATIGKGGHGIYSSTGSINVSESDYIYTLGGRGGQSGGFGMYAPWGDIALSVGIGVYAYGGAAGAQGGVAGDGIMAGGNIVITASSILAKGGASNEANGGSGIATSAGGILITGDIDAIGGDGNQYGGFGICASAPIVINGDVDAKGGFGTLSEGGIAIACIGSLIVSGSNISATGGSSNAGDTGEGIFTIGNITMAALNGTIRVAGGDSNSGYGATGVFATGSLYMKGDTVVRGGNGTTGGNGIVADGTIHLTEGQTTVAGGNSISDRAGAGILTSSGSSIYLDCVLKSLGGNGTKANSIGGKSILTERNGAFPASVNVEFMNTGAGLLLKDGRNAKAEYTNGFYLNGDITATRSALPALTSLKWGISNTKAIAGGGLISSSGIDVVTNNKELLKVWLDNTASEPADIHDDINNDVPGSGGYWSGTTQYIIKAEAGTGGKIDPAGNVYVATGGEKKFTVTPDDGYKISDVLVDGKSVGTDSTYTFKDVQRSHTIKVTFVKADMDGTLPFSDIENHWAKDNILNVYEKGLMNGTGDGKFSPNDNMTRGMAATILGRFFELENGMGIAGYTDTVFADVLPGKYYFTYVNWGADKGILNGTGTNAAGIPVYEPENFVTREQMAKLIDGLLKTMNIELNENSQVKTFTDQDSVSDWARESVLRMQSAGIITGRTDGSFDPQGLITRAEAATMLERLMKLAE